MYPNIRSVITDAEGKPVAYPYQLLLGHWQVNELLWQHVFGNTSLPTTYDEFLDAMVLWESKYIDDFPEIDFSGDFDHAYWVRNIVNAYAQQYGQTDSSMSLDTPVLRSALEKLEQVRDIRKDYGRSTHFSDEYMPKIDMFITAGFNNVLLDPPELPSQGFQTDDIQEGIYTDMPALVFAQGEKSLIPGKMLVWFVNPYSQNKELAIQYLEHAARMENNPRTYYATHPYLNDPLEYAGYEQSVQEMMRRRDDLTELLEKAEDADRSDIEDDLIYVENWLSNQEKMKWMISETAINIYRSFAPNISFFEDNQYITPDGSKMLQQLEGLYQRYADGVINLDAFLKELDEKMHMLYIEGE